MPGNVATLSGIADTYPFTQFAQFSVVLSASTAMFEYPDGSSQRRNKAANPRRSWTVSHRLSATDVAIMRAFYRSHLIAPFRFTDISNGLIYTAVFAGPYSEERSFNNRFNVSLQLQEAA